MRPTWLSLLARDTAIVAVALILAIFEVIFGGARPTVLTFVLGLLGLPIVLRADKKIRGNGENGKDE